MLSINTLLPLLERAFEGVLVVEPKSLRIIYANPTVCGRLGRNVVELIGQPVTELFKSESRPAVMEAVANLPSDVQAGNDLLALRLNEGEWAVAARFCRIESDRLNVIGILLQDAPASHENYLRGQQRRDPLTGLLDRDFLDARLKHLLANSHSDVPSLGVLFVDLNNFKELNDRFGHIVGDRVLREAARRLASCVRGEDQVVRYGGDEFVVLVEQIGERFEIDELVGRIQRALEEPISLPDGDVTLSASVGMALAGPEHRTPEELLAAADRAMYAAKRK
jgi:diguanylate cyclase (GGDEF)-like protein